MNFQKAFKLFIETLRRDKHLFYAYQANIAMAFVDESRRRGSRDSYKKVHNIANTAAINFLNMLIKPMPKAEKCKPVARTRRMSGNVKAGI